MTRSKKDGARISFKNSVILCRHLRGKRLQKAIKLLEDLRDQKRSLKGKYLTNTSKEILQVLKNAQANARQKGFNLDKTFVRKINAGEGFTFARNRSRAKLRGTLAKTTNLFVEVEER